MRARLLAVATAAIAMLVSGTTPAQAADTTPPTLRLQPWAHYRLGSTLDTVYDSSSGTHELDYWTATFQIRWSASDPSGICRQRLSERSYDTLTGDGNYDDPVLGPDSRIWTVPKTLRQYSFTTNMYDLGRAGDRFVVRATDCAGNTATSTIAQTTFGLSEDTAPRITYAGSWRVSRFTGFSGGTTHATTAAGASATITVPGGPVALVMEQAADRGSADVLVDGFRRATVNTYSRTTMHRRVVWEAVLPAGSHRVRVVNRATSGHPRIDLDAVLRPGPLF